MQILSNNPPAVTLELTKEQAEFLLKNCTSNMSMGLQLLQGVDDVTAAQKVINMLENFKQIRELLLKQGVKEPE